MQSNGAWLRLRGNGHYISTQERYPVSYNKLVPESKTDPTPLTAVIFTILGGQIKDFCNFLPTVVLC